VKHGLLNSLFGRTSLVVTLAFVLFSLFALFAARQHIFKPVHKRAAEDLSALLVLSAKVWVELPPWTRADYVNELFANHQLLILEADNSIPCSKHDRYYLKLVESALSRRIKQPTHILEDERHPDWYWVDINTGNKNVRIGFFKNRLRDRIPTTLIVISIIGVLVILLTTILIVRHINKPLARLTQAVGKISDQQAFEPLEETGPTELAYLARRINKSEQEVQALLENRTTLLAGISHDLRTPLTRMQLLLALLPDNVPQEQIDSLNDDIDVMNRLIGQTLSLARNMSRYDSADVCLSDLLKQLIREYQRSSHVIIIEQPGECDCSVPFEPMKRVLDNLLENAFKHSGDHQISMIIACNHNDLTIRIQDHGPGIPKQYHESVFDPFFRPDKSRSASTGGSGLGLAIVKQLCHFYGWSINISNMQQGGLEVRLQIPQHTAC
jgi:two-component system osmolarity sensor histidine kinase EnvZ